MKHLKTCTELLIKKVLTLSLELWHDLGLRFLDYFCVYGYKYTKKMQSINIEHHQIHAGIHKYIHRYTWVCVSCVCLVYMCVYTGVYLCMSILVYTAWCILVIMHMYSITYILMYAGVYLMFTCIYCIRQNF